MGDDPARNVTDGGLRVHGSPNLYVAGSAVFATGGAANPTLTIVALSRRLADHLHARLMGAPREAPALPG
jgi:choline dehydrogenase-like flavoprotein